MTTLDVVHAHDELGIGGTQKAIETLVRTHDSDRCDVGVLITEAPGERGAALAADGYDVRVVDGPDGVGPYLQERRPDVVHVHSRFDGHHGVVRAAADAGVPAVYKTTQFGVPDDGAVADLIDRYLFVSKTILLRYLALHGADLDGDWDDDHRVLWNPLETADLDPGATGGYRDRFSIPEDAPVVGKIGRSAPEKWGRITVDALAGVLDERPEAHALMVNTPGKIERRLADRVPAGRVHFVDFVSPYDIDGFYGDVDVLTHSSAIGESYGYVLTEAMACETPVVVNSQPLRDNAQVEVVDNRETGYVANDPGTYAGATVELLDDDDRRGEMGATGRQRVAERYGAAEMTRRLETMYGATLVGEGAVDPDDLAWWEGDAPTVDLAAFAREYAGRLRDHYGRAGRAYELERRAWDLVTRLPAGRWPAYDLARKGFLFVNEYL
jgi:glycosyltransferase involved in cell wall biosynthesis